MKPRRLVHQGTVLAEAFWLDTSILGTNLTRQRILEMRGVKEVRRMEGGLFVRLQAPVWVASDHAPGVPLVLEHETFTSAPFDPDELDELAAPTGTVVLVRAGECVVVAPDSCELEDVASWIDLSDWKLENVQPLGIVWTSPRAAPRAKDIDPRKVAGIGAPPKEADAVLAALRRDQATSSPARSPGIAASLLTSISTFLSSIAARLRRPPSQTSEQPSTSRALVAMPAKPQPRGDWADRLRMALNSAAARFLLWARLASWIGRQQAEYLDKTLSLFDSGDLDEALRHAIPLGTGTGQPKPLALSVPTPRTDLSIRPIQTEASSTLGFGGNVFEALRARYRKAVEVLEKQGKIKEAAFVLAELLGAHEEAVSFLEKHGEYQLAAELAEGRQLEPALVVRQWILAGNRERAVLIARRTGAFAAAIAKLEQSHPEQAAVLRVLWANQLASSGAYAAAVQAIWPVEKARNLARDWIDRGIAVGGVPGARLLATKAWLVPEEFASVCAVIRNLPRDDADDSVDTWTALAQSVLANPSSKTMRILARSCLRMLLPHVAESTTKSLVDRLTTLTEDHVLIADLRRQEFKPAPVHEVRLRVGACTDVGLARDVNEDGYWVWMVDDEGCKPFPRTSDEMQIPPRGAVFAVADGCGGRQAVKVVQLVFGTIATYLRSADKRPENISSSLAQAVEEAGVAVFKKGVEDRKFAGSGATITAGWMMGDTLWIAQVGDTRAYLYRDGRLALLTKDHSLVNELIDTGKLTVEEAATFEHKSVITRALGTVERVKVDMYRLALHDGDRILLCTDGVHGLLKHDEMADALRRPKNVQNQPEFEPKSACFVLKQKVYEAQAPDNLAMVIVDVHLRQGPSIGWSLPIAERIEIGDAPAPAPPEKRLITRDATDRGTMDVYDAVVLPGGRLLVALGEAGVRMVSPEGKTLVHFDQPAKRIVLSDHGDRAIVLIVRGGSCRTARIDLVRRRAERWFDAVLRDFADTFDGSLWFVSLGSQVSAIDALENEFQSIWSLHEQCSMPILVMRSTNGVGFIIRHETWCYELPSFRLRKNVSLPDNTGAAWGDIKGISDGSVVCWLGDSFAGNCAPTMAHAGDKSWTSLGDCQSDDHEEPRVAIEETAKYGAFYRCHDEVLHVDVYNLREKKMHLQVRLEKTSRAHVRFQGPNMVVADDRGRVIVVNIERNKILHEWRI